MIAGKIKISPRLNTTNEQTNKQANIFTFLRFEKNGVVKCEYIFKTLFISFTKHAAPMWQQKRKGSILLALEFNLRSKAVKSNYNCFIRQSFLNIYKLICGWDMYLLELCLTQGHDCRKFGEDSSRLKESRVPFRLFNSVSTPYSLFNVDIWFINNALL